MKSHILESFLTCIQAAFLDILSTLPILFFT